MYGLLWLLTQGETRKTSVSALHRVLISQS